MIRAAICTLVCTTLFAVGCNSMGHSSQQAAGNAAVVAGARTPKEAADNFYAALQAIFRGETAAMNDAWWHDADTTYMGPGGDFRTGWVAIEKEWNTQASQKLGGKVEPTRMHWTQTNEVALLTCIEVGTNDIGGKDVGAKDERVEIRSSTSFSKRDGVWKAISHQTDKIAYVK
jgi:hypothetical protein